MSDKEHVRLLLGGEYYDCERGEFEYGPLSGLDNWYLNHPKEGLDLSSENFQNKNFAGICLRKANLSSANLKEANLKETDLKGANLKEANLEGANLKEANLKEANLIGTILNNANLSQTNLSNVRFVSSCLAEGANFTNTDLRGSAFEKANLSGANLTGSNLSHSNIINVNFTKAKLARCNFFEAKIEAGTNFSDSEGLEKAINLETVIEEGRPIYFEKCLRRWSEKLFDWERLRIVGKLPLFAVSYTILIMIPIFFYGLSLYNNKLEIVREWATLILMDPSVSAPMRSIAEIVSVKLHLQPIPHLSFHLLISTILLATASTLYTIFCPSRIKEFSKDQWVDQLDRPLFHYWPFSWKHRYIRLFCVFCYFFGGFGVLCVIIAKVWRVGVFIWENSAL